MVDWLRRPVVSIAVVLALAGCSGGGSGDAGEDAEVATAAGTTSGVADGSSSAVPMDPDAVIEAPVVTDDGRMLQPEGHVGLWFEMEPEDPLEHLVWASQRYVGQKVVLQPVGDRAVLPQWADMPDACDPEVIARMEALGLEELVDSETGIGLVQCSLISDWSEGVLGTAGSILWGARQVEDVQDEIGVSASDDVTLISLKEGNLADAIGCTSIGIMSGGKYVFYVATGDVSKADQCRSSALAAQLVINLMGGSIYVQV